MSKKQFFNLKFFLFLWSIFKNKNEKWWRIRCDIVYGGKPEAVGVNIREDQNGNLYYDHYTVNERETLGSQSQSISPITDDSIAENEYVVIIFFE